MKMLHTAEPSTEPWGSPRVTASAGCHHPPLGSAFQPIFSQPKVLLSRPRATSFSRGMLKISTVFPLSTECLLSEEIRLLKPHLPIRNPWRVGLIPSLSCRRWLMAPKVIFSSTKIRLTGLKFLGLSFPPFLQVGITSATLQAAGPSPVSQHCW